MRTALLLSSPLPWIPPRSINQSLKESPADHSLIVEAPHIQFMVVHPADGPPSHTLVCAQCRWRGMEVDGGRPRLENPKAVPVNVLDRLDLLG